MFRFLATETVVQTKYHGAVKCGKQIRFQLLLGSGGWEGAEGWGWTHASDRIPYGFLLLGTGPGSG